MADKTIDYITTQQLKKQRANIGPAYDFLALNTWDMVYYFDDFMGDLVRGDATSPGLYEVATGVDGDIAILADQANGVAQMGASVGAGATGEYCVLTLPELAFTGSRNCGMAARVNLDAISTVKLEVGFIDLTTRIGVVNVLATPTYTATDGVVWIMDTSDTAYWQCCGVKNTTGATKIEPAAQADHAPVAGTFQTLVVKLEQTGTTGDACAYFYLLDANNDLIYSSSGMANAVTSTVGLSPMVGITLRGAVDRHVRIDFLAAWQLRNA